MHIETDRLSGSTTIDVDTVTNVPDKFIGTYGTLGSNGLITDATRRNFRGHTSSGNIIIDAFEPGSTDDGNTAGQVIIIKPNTGWADRIASFVKNAKNFGTPDAVWFGAVTAVSATVSGALSAASAAISGALTVGGNLEVTGTSRVIATSIASDAAPVPTSQMFDITALALGATIAVPSFTPQNGMSLIIRIKDNGTAQALSFAAGYTNVSGLDTPTATVANKLLTIGAIYNSATSKWEIQGISQQA
jgi:hypothetical protein